VAHRVQGRVWLVLVILYFPYPAVLEIIAIALVLLWLLGIAALCTFGGLIHLLLLAAVVVILIRVHRGNRSSI